MNLEKGSFIKENKIFKDKVSYINKIFKKEVSFLVCNFEDKVSFIGCTFKKEVSFQESSFSNKARFHETKFLKTVDFENTVFKDLADFWKAIFEGKQEFHLTDFLGVTIFSNVEFKEELVFLYNKVSNNSIISFEGATFEKSIDISRANFWCKVTFWNSKIKKNLPDLKKGEGCLYMKVHAENKEDEEEALKRLRESYRIIKNNFDKEGNRIESLKYFNYEMKIYEKELLVKIKEFVKSKEPVGVFWDILLLKISKYSNNFGISWFRGVLFTLIVTFISYILFLYTYRSEITFDCSEYSPWIKHFFEFLNISNWDFKPFGLEGNNFSYIVFYIGRIFIGYGYYQTIQAFRKYGRK